MKDLPNKDWSTDQLADYCRRVGRSQAEDAWKVGRACLIVKSRVPRGEWLDWVGNVFGRPALRTIERYMAVAERFGPDEIAGKTLCELYSAIAKAEGKTPSPKKQPDPKTGPHAPVSEPGPPTPEKLVAAVSHFSQELVEVFKALATFPERKRRAAWREVSPATLRAAVEVLNEQIAWLERNPKSAA